MTDAKAPFTADFRAMPVAERYKLLTGVVVPRPIALVTTLGPNGVVNAAPFSFFNAISADPTLVVLGLDVKDDGSTKDTPRNILSAGGFVVNLVDEALAPAMNVCATDFPSEMSEITAAGLTLAPGTTIKVPRIVQAPVALECRHHISLEVGLHHRLTLGEVLYLHARPGLVDPRTLRVDVDAYKPVARLFGNWYARLGERFLLERQTYETWKRARAANSNATDTPPAQ